VKGGLVVPASLQVRQQQDLWLGFACCDDPCSEDQLQLSVQGGIEDEELPGPARPPPTAAANDAEIPGHAQPEVWSKLPAPRARRVVQLQLPIHKSLLGKSGPGSVDSDDEDEEAARRRKRLRAGAGSGGSGGGSKLLGMLPAPKNAGLGRGSKAIGAGLGGSAPIGGGSVARYYFLGIAVSELGWFQANMIPC
jgi:hypothetical protein